MGTATSLYRWPATGPAPRLYVQPGSLIKAALRGRACVVFDKTTRDKALPVIASSAKGTPAVTLPKGKLVASRANERVRTAAQRVALQPQPIPRAERRVRFSPVPVIIASGSMPTLSATTQIRHQSLAQRPDYSHLSVREAEALRSKRSLLWAHIFSTVVHRLAVKRVEAYSEEATVKPKTIFDKPVVAARGISGYVQDLHRSCGGGFDPDTYVVALAFLARLETANSRMALRPTNIHCLGLTALYLADQVVNPKPLQRDAALWARAGGVSLRDLVNFGGTFRGTISGNMSASHFLRDGARQLIYEAYEEWLSQGTKAVL